MKMKESLQNFEAVQSILWFFFK